MIVVATSDGLGGIRELLLRTLAEGRSAAKLFP